MCPKAQSDARPKLILKPVLQHLVRRSGEEEGFANHALDAYIAVMSDLMRYSADLANMGVEAGAGKSAPPVDQWNPDYCGQLDLVIRRDGSWVHEGSPIGRAKLVRLFSTVIKKEGDDYFLVTPVEKLSIQVEDVPFLIAGLEIDNPGRDQVITLSTNVGDKVILDADVAFGFRTIMGTDERAPYVNVRRNLDARLSRAVYYDLANHAHEADIDGKRRFGFWSSARFFDFDDGLDLAAKEDAS